MDTDVYGPNVPIMVGIDADPIVRGQKLIPHEAYSVKVMSLGFLNRGDKPVVWRGPMLHSAVKQFLYDVEWGNLDYLIVDMPPGTGDAQLSLAQLVPVQGAVIVTTPQEVSMADVRKAINMFDQVHIPILGIVENMSHFTCSNCSERHHIFGSGGEKSLPGGSGRICSVRFLYRRACAKAEISECRLLLARPTASRARRLSRLQKMWGNRSTFWKRRAGDSPSSSMGGGSFEV